MMFSSMLLFPTPPPPPSFPLLLLVEKTSPFDEIIIVADAMSEVATDENDNVINAEAAVSTLT